MCSLVWSVQVECYRGLVPVTTNKKRYIRFSRLQVYVAGVSLLCGCVFQRTCRLLLVGRITLQAKAAVYCGYIPKPPEGAPTKYLGL